MSKGSQSRQNKTQELAKQWLTKGGIFHEDSDDELGCEDLPWQWIYGSDGNLSNASDGTSSPSHRRIIGARMGAFECRVGQAVLLKSPEAGKDWAGIICEFLEEEPDEDEDPDQDGLVKSANIMWFASPDEFISTRNKKRLDALPNEQYITVDFNINPLKSINGTAVVLSKDAFFAKYPNGKPPKGRAALVEHNKCIVCRRGVNQLQGRYTEEFVWEDVHRETEEGALELVERIKAGLKRSRKRKALDGDVRSPNINSIPLYPSSDANSPFGAGCYEDRPVCPCDTEKETENCHRRGNAAVKATPEGPHDPYSKKVPGCCIPYPRKITSS